QNLGAGAADRRGRSRERAAEAPAGAVSDQEDLIGIRSEVNRFGYEPSCRLIRLRHGFVYLLAIRLDAQYDGRRHATPVGVGRKESRSALRDLNDAGRNRTIRTGDGNRRRANGRAGRDLEVDLSRRDKKERRQTLDTGRVTHPDGRAVQRGRQWQG